MLAALIAIMVAIINAGDFDLERQTSIRSLMAEQYMYELGISDCSYFVEPIGLILFSPKLLSMASY